MLKSPFELRMLSADDLVSYCEHLHRHLKESGQEGDQIFHPFEDLKGMRIFENQQKIADAWKIPVGDLGWERVWGVWDSEQRQWVGHCDLRQVGPPTALHRAMLGMGVEKKYRGKKIGKALINAAIDWSKQEEKFAYIDLNVFSNNLPAIALYQQCGFTTTATRKDRFRIFGRRIDDIIMVLDL